MKSCEGIMVRTQHGELETMGQSIGKISEACCKAKLILNAHLSITLAKNLCILKADEEAPPLEASITPSHSCRSEYYVLLPSQAGTLTKICFGLVNLFSPH